MCLAAVAMKTLIVMCGVVLCMVGLAVSQFEPSCGQLVRDVKETLYHNLARSSEFSDLVEHKCITRRGR